MGQFVGKQSPAVARFGAELVFAEHHMVTGGIGQRVDITRRICGLFIRVNPYLAEVIVRWSFCHASVNVSRSRSRYDV
jgi:hypothetical protein